MYCSTASLISTEANAENGDSKPCRRVVLWILRQGRDIVLLRAEVVGVVATRCGETLSSRAKPLEVSREIVKLSVVENIGRPGTEYNCKGKERERMEWQQE